MMKSESKVALQGAAAVAPASRLAFASSGARGRPTLVWLGAGMTAYGATYLVFHDMMVHGRFGRVKLPRNAYMLRLIRAHRIHHCGGDADGTRNFGFLFAARSSTQATRK